MRAVGLQVPFLGSEPGGLLVPLLQWELGWDWMSWLVPLLRWELGLEVGLGAGLLPLLSSVRLLVQLKCSHAVVGRGFHHHRCLMMGMLWVEWWVAEWTEWSVAVVVVSPPHSDAH